MAGQLNASPQLMDDFSKKMDTTHGSLLTHISSTKADQEHTTASWSGGARGAFDTFMERYYEQAQAMTNKLASTVDALMKTSKAYAQSDETFQQDIAKHNSSLDLPAI